MVDVARHFLPVPDLEKIVGLMAGYKMNVLHLHLTDDQGWRLDIPSRPELVARSSQGAVNGDHGGSYTGSDWAGLVAYAAAHGVTVVPEIDIPGHTNAALHAIPALNPGGVAPDAYEGIQVGFSTLHADLPETAPFLSDVFGDVAAMTPGDYVHVGGDEATSTADEEYSCLVCTAMGDVTAAGKKVVGWQEIAKATPLPPGTVIQYWDERADAAPILAAAKAGAKVLLSPASRVYLDMKYDGHTALGQTWAGEIELRRAYDWDPATELHGLDPSSIAGVEAAIWTETLGNVTDVEYMLLPRLAAVAEKAWSTTNDWHGFRDRVAPQAAAWDQAGLVWYMSPEVNWQR
jgi:hexosaminidase